MVAITLIVLVVIVVIISILFILSRIPAICLFDKCFTLLSEDFGVQVSFWFLLIAWILIQVILIYAYIQLGKLGLGIYYRAKTFFARAVNFIDGLFKR